MIVSVVPRTMSVIVVREMRSDHTASNAHNLHPIAEIIVKNFLLLVRIYLLCARSYVVIGHYDVVQSSKQSLSVELREL